MFENMRTERAKLQKALGLATAALAFYGDPNSYLFRRSKPRITPVVTIDGGKLARMTLGDLAKHLDEGAQCELRRCQLMAGDCDEEGN